MIASLPMYDRHLNHAAHDSLWALIRDGLRSRGIEAPDTLDRKTPHMEGWGRTDLVLGQICYLPLRALFRDRITIIGSCDYGLPDCEPGYYRSQFIVRADDPAQTPEDALTARYRLAVNEGLSHSGWGSVWRYCQSRDLTPNPTVRTMAHSESVRAVRTGRADLAAIDMKTYQMLTIEGLTDGLRVIGQTEPSPGMTFITRIGQDPAPYFAAISDAIRVIPDAEKLHLGLVGIVPLAIESLDLPLPPSPGDLPN